MSTYNEQLKNIKPDLHQVNSLKNSPAFSQFLQDNAVGNAQFDSADTAVYHFLRDLEYVKTKVLEVKYPELTALSIFPVDRSTPPGAEKAGYEVADMIGGAQIQANHSNDVRRVDIKSEWIDVGIKQIENFFDYSFRDIRAAQFAGRPLQDLKAKASNRDIHEEINALAWAGDGNYKIKGVLSDGTGIQESSMPDILANMSAIELNKAITEKVAKMHADSRGVFSPDTLVLPLEQYDRLFDEIFDGTALSSPGKWILENNRHIKRILPAPELMADSGVNPHGAPVGVLFEYNRDNIAIEVPMPPTMRAPHPTLTGFQVLNEARCGGAFVKQPMSAMILTNL